MSWLCQCYFFLLKKLELPGLPSKCKQRYDVLVVVVSSRPVTHHKASVLTLLLVGSFCLQREEILESRKRRAQQLQAMLDDNKQRLADHHAGTKLLSDKDKASLEKKINIYQRKLETLEGDLDDREVERIIKREQLRDERLKSRRDRRDSRRDEL